MMVIKKFMALKTQFDYISKRMSSRDMVRVIGSIWVFVCKYLFFVCGFISRYILIRIQEDDHRNTHHVDFLEHDNQFDSNKEEEHEYLDFPIRITKDDQNRAETEDLDDQNRAEAEDSCLVKTVSAVSTDLYEYISHRAINGYMEEPKSMSFTVQEFYVNSGSSKFSDYQVPIKAAEEEGDDTDHENSADYNEILEALENELQERPVIDQSILEEFRPEKVSDAEIDAHEVEEDSFSIDFDSKQSRHDPVIPRKDEEVGSLKYEFLIYRNVAQYEDEGLQPQSSVFQYNEEDPDLLDLSIRDGKADSFSDHCDDYESSDDEYIELLEPQLRSYTQQLDQVEEKGKQKEQLVQDETQDTSPLAQMLHSAEEDGNVLQQQMVSGDADDSYNEHDDLIEQIKREIKYIRTGGLPTISESTSIVENIKLKPLKIDDKLEYKDRILEIQKVYGSYAEKMRKLDILNNQTMHAIGFLQLKNQVKPNSSQKSSINPIMKSFLSQNILRCNRLISTVDPMPKFVGDLHKDLELVYVGHVCLSWEILHWQHKKAQELLQYDNHRYNAVAAEFQLFQVLLHRFIEDDPFQGPRMQHYVRKRCALCNLLQVPPIRDDHRKDKKHGTGEEDEDLIIVGERLVKIIEESMHIYWNFLRSDDRSAVLKSLQENQVEHKDLKLLIDIRKDLQKKDKKLKDIQRSGNCVVKKFHKQQNQDQNRFEHSLFVAQVQLRLVLRVLNMTKLTSQQLVWCHEKLHNINFVHRKVFMEPLFLFFPF